MTADVIYVWLYCHKSLYLAAILYLLFLAMCVAGYTGWKKSLASRAAGIPQEAPAL